ncbi:hypothetical protein ACU4GD_22840 [Cupriavidus basilensis]
MRIDVTASPAERFAAISAGRQPAGRRTGRARLCGTFQRVCFSCHTLNRVGDAQPWPRSECAVQPGRVPGRRQAAPG